MYSVDSGIARNFLKNRGGVATGELLAPPMRHQSSRPWAGVGPVENENSRIAFVDPIGQRLSQSHFRRTFFARDAQRVRLLSGHDGNDGRLSSQLAKVTLYDRCTDAFRNGEVVLGHVAPQPGQQAPLGSADTTRFSTRVVSLARADGTSP